MPAYFRNRSSFYFVLLGVFLVHAMFMVIKLKEHIETTWKAPEMIKLRLIQDHIEQALHKKQIVQSEDSASAEKPLEDAYQSDKDRKFDRQTIARKVDTFKKAAQGNASLNQKKVAESSAKKKAAHKDLKLSDFGFSAGDPLPKEVSRSPASEAIKGMKTGDPVEQGLSATNDYVKEVALGDFTHLNTVEYKYYGFFHRIRQKLEQFWGKSIHEKANNLFRSGRRLPANEDLITSLQITLNTKGEIVKVKILGTSGVKDLDDAAIESFNQAGPFPNPPKDLLVNGKAVIEWGFVVKG